MKTPDQYQSDNVNDLRDGDSSGLSLGSSATGMGAALIPIVSMLFRTKSGRIIGLVLIVVMLFGGSRLGNIFSGTNSPFSQIGNPYAGLDQPSNRELSSGQAPTDAEGIFVSYVLDDTNEFWEQTFSDAGERYTPTQLNIFDGAVNTACGTADSSVGPFYCPGDSQTYIDLVFFNELATRFSSQGDFAQAYVIAHEVGHHVQNELGINAQANKLKREGVSDNAVSVRIELQADCLAGVWAHSAEQRGLLEVGDIDEALNAAANIGDDSLQKQAGQNVNAEAFTHGSAAQRKKWLSVGYTTGDMSKCNTFKDDLS